MFNYEIKKYRGGSFCDTKVFVKREPIKVITKRVNSFRIDDDDKNDDALVKETNKEKLVKKKKPIKKYLIGERLLYKLTK